jgi:hypothetical protein
MTYESQELASLVTRKECTIQEQNNTVLFHPTKIINYDTKNNEGRTEILSLGSLHLFRRIISAIKIL